MGGCLSAEGGRREVGKGGGGGLAGSGGGEYGFLSKYGSFGEDELHRIPGRMFLNGASDVACLYTQQGKKGTNQDAMIVWEEFASREDIIFCGVFDGHGPFGHMVSKKVRDSLPLKLLYGWRPNLEEDKNSVEKNIAKGCMKSEEDREWTEVSDVEESDNFPEMYLSLRNSLLKAFRLMDKELKLHPTVDSFCSGTTAVTLVKQGQDVVLANVGDSRAVLGTRDEDNSLVAVQLTEDLKPNLPKEAARIQMCKGRVFALQDEPEVARVWLPNCDSPGLAMARAFGDFCLKDFGLISVPDICYHRLTPNDEFVVLATDGVWDVLSNQEVIDIVAGVSSRHTAARALVDCAVRAWRLKFPTSKVDDCAAICLFVDPGSDTNHESNVNTPKDDEVSSQESDSFDDNTVHERTVEPSASPSLATQLSGTDEITSDTDVQKSEVPDRCNSARSLAECVFSSEEEWSALEGVTRVNSLVNLPRFGTVNKKPGSWRKWL